jgi:hypothetical protein
MILEQVFSALFSLHRGTPHYGEWVIACMQGSWSKIVGERLAEACRPVQYSKSELVIEILDKSWEDAVKNLKLELLDKLRAMTSCKINSIKMVSGWQAAVFIVDES